MFTSKKDISIHYGEAANDLSTSIIIIIYIAVTSSSNHGQRP